MLTLRVDLFEPSPVRKEEAMVLINLLSEKITGVIVKVARGGLRETRPNILGGAEWGICLS